MPVRKFGVQLAALLLAAGVAGAPAAWGQASGAGDYPSRPVRLVVGFSPGGGTDTVARILADRLGTIWKGSVVVENRPGAGGQIADAFVAKAPPDGYTVLLDSASFTLNPALFKSLPYDSIKDFAPISLTSQAPYVLVVNPAVPAKSVKELIALAKAEPGKLNYASGGVGSSLHLATELFRSMAGVDMTHVPYQGANGIPDLVSGRVQLSFAGVPQVLAHVRSGALRPLAVTTLERTKLLPDIPTVSEAGVSGYEFISWHGAFAPAGTPKPIIDKINAGLLQALKDEGVRSKLAAQGIDAVGTTPEKLGSHVKEEIAKWSKIVQEAGIKPQ